MKIPKFSFEDMTIGTKIEFGPRFVSAEEIIHFASQFDPAPFHLDEAAGKASMLGGLAASGWHVCSIAMRMICDAYLLQSSSQGSPGLSKCQWLAPVLANDILHGSITVMGARLSASRPGLGIIEFDLELFNQKGIRVIAFSNTGMMLTRKKAAEVAPVSA